MMETETIDRLFLELSQFTKAATAKELALQEKNALLRASIEFAVRSIEAVNVWGGDVWHYDQLSPSEYLPALDELRAALALVPSP